MVWIFGGSSHANVCVWEGKGSRARQRAVYEQFCILFLFSPIPHFLLPLSPSFIRHPPSLPQSPPPAGCLIISRFQRAVGLLEELQVCWWNLAEKVVGPGRGSWHNKPKGNERLPLVARVRKYNFQRELETKGKWHLTASEADEKLHPGCLRGRNSCKAHSNYNGFLWGREVSWASSTNLLSPVSSSNVRDNLDSCAHILPLATNHPHDLIRQPWWWVRDFVFWQLFFCRHFEMWA